MNSNPVTRLQGPKGFAPFAVKVAVVHTLTYAAFGLVMSAVFGYQRVFEQAVVRDYMRPYDSPFVLAGPLLQPIRGLVIAMALWLIRPLIFDGRQRWLTVWAMLVLIGIIAAPSAAPNSIEGVIYTKLPLWYHLGGLPELLLQTLTFSIVLERWVMHPAATRATPLSPSQAVLTQAMRALMAGCFGYIGYALGGLIVVKIANVTLDIGQAASDVKTQLMFVVALVVNVITAFLAARAFWHGKLAVVPLFLLFWLIDTAVPLTYQALVLGSPSPLDLGLVLGFFPALIIALTIRLAYSPQRPRAAPSGKPH